MGHSMQHPPRLSFIIRSVFVYQLTGKLCVMYAAVSQRNLLTPAPAAGHASPTVAKRGFLSRG